TKTFYKKIGGNFSNTQFCNVISLQNGYINLFSSKDTTERIVRHYAGYHLDLVHSLIH
ncbi:hypothetical protein HMPREF9999_00207, partial [Alloprevotella sp. oral taxon 473 str. F0040]